ncbi:M28 family metallopeptidase [Zunongwangia pacifica]|uniref:M28 family metallopeptidase n=1 Tax=Zunongwangia pacifica TaxID=2911062 RepID=A0A9X2CMN2_9FLAO|nr:M28 family metallopeptidase [Zunongwangia pacifica]MCL6217709.1 M28 family metallopeptidase [Zunongwangia pacifica]
MKKLLVFALTASLVACGAHQKDVDNADPMKYAETITPSDLKERVYIFASDEFEGRETGEPGQKKAAEYLKEQYKKFDIPSALGGDDYFQEVPKSYFRGDTKASENVVAFIKGSEKPEEILVISSHYDHVGMDKDGNVFNGADDDASGTMGVVEIAQAFSKAVKDGYTPKRSILFLNNTGEEKGLVGSKFYTDNPIFPLEETVANLNIDMIGRIDPDHEGNDNYIYLIGSDKLSTELHELSEEVNSKYMNLDLDYTYNDENDPNRFYYRSDHYNFAKNNVPVIFYFNGVHADYHKITDTPDKINYEALSKRAQLVFLTAWEIANRDERLVVDKAE